MFHAGLLKKNTDTGSRLRDWPAHYLRCAETAQDPRLKAFYAAGIPAADTPLRATPLMALDIETTGLDPVRDGIVSIGTVPLRGEVIETSASRHWLLKPRVDLSDESITIHGITHSHIANAPDLNNVLSDILETLAGHVVVVHYRTIERQFLNGGLLPRIGEGIDFPVIDTMELEARRYRPKPPGFWARLFGRKTPPRVSIRLADSRSRFGLPHYRPHHALTDALACAELLQAQIAHRYSWDAPVGTFWR